jgi:DNA-binding transcriptional LysR family regulator
MLATQRHLAMLPSSLVHFSASRLSIKALPITLPVEPRSIGIVTLKNRTISPVAQLIVQAARAITKPMAKMK